MPADSQALYATLAQVSATVASVLGGLLLSVAVSRAAEKRRLERSLQRQKQIEAELVQESETYREEQRRADEAQRAALLLIQQRARQGQLTTEQESAERLAAAERMERLAADRSAHAAKQARRLRAVRRDADDIADQLEAERLQLRMLAGGFVLFVLLALVGVGLPVYLLSGDPAAEPAIVRWLALYGTVTLLTGSIVYVMVVFFITSSSSPSEPKRRPEHDT